MALSENGNTFLLEGPPGTGKTSLAKGVAARSAEALAGSGRVRFVEIDPHALASASLGKSSVKTRTNA